MNRGSPHLPCPAVVLLSGRGSNLHAIIRAIAEQALPLHIRAVISNRPDAAGLRLAHDAGLETRVVDHTRFSSRCSFDAELQTLIDSYQPSLVILAGFMRILSDAFVKHYRGRLLNIHPSLLPAYTGLNTHQRALTDGARWAGASVHFVTAELDGGPLVIQACLSIRPDDDAAALATRVLQLEHYIYPLALRWLAEGIVWLDTLDGKDCTRFATFTPAPDATFTSDPSWRKK